MRALLVDYDTATFEPMARAVADLCQLEGVTTKDLCLERLGADAFDVAIVCDRLADGSGLELLVLIAEKHPEVLRAFGAEPRRLTQVSGRLGRFNVLESVRYPISVIELRSLLKYAKAVQDANADTSNMQHIVLEGDAPVQNENARVDSRLELAPEWRPDENALIQPKPDPKAALADIELPQWTVEGSDKPTPQAPTSGRNLVSSSKLVAIRGGAAPNDRRPAHNGGAAQRDAGTIHNFSAAQRNANSSSSLGTSQRSASTIYGVDSSHSEHSARFGVGASQHLAHSRAVQEAAVAETKAFPTDRPHARRVVIVLTRDKECLDTTIAALAGQAVSMVHAADEDMACKALRKHGAIAVLADIAMVTGSPRRFLERICVASGEAPVIAVGRTSDTLQVAPMLSAGTVQRYLVKPINRAQTRKVFESVLQLPVNSDPTVPRESVPFASLIDRVTATDLRSSLNKQPWRVRLTRMTTKYWHWAVGGVVLGVSAMLALAVVLSG